MPRSVMSLLAADDRTGITFEYMAWAIMLAFTFEATAATYAGPQPDRTGILEAEDRTAHVLSNRSP